ncbi:MAG: hypothetical protein ACRDT4_04080 [Micromonosporaceae bacterium]
MTSRWRPRLGAERLIVDEIGGGLLVRTVRDPVVALTAMTGALPPEPGRIAVVTAPSVTMRSDYLQLVGQVIDDRTGGGSVGVRLVALGDAAALSTAESHLRALSYDLGRELVAPLGSLSVGADGTVAVAAPGGAGGGWVTYAPGAPPHYEPAWYPLPAWAADVPPEMAGVTVFGTAAAYPVPAGYWILPRGLQPGRAGSPSTMPPDDTMATVFLGGFTGPPVALDDIVLSLAALPLPDRYRLVLLPGALDSPEDAAYLRTYCDPAVLATAAVPVWSGGSMWSLAFVGAAGSLTRQLPGGTGPEGLRPGPRVAGVVRPARARRSASDQRRRLPRGTRTAAGWSFLTGSEPVGVVPAPTGFVVEVDTDADGFRIDGKPVTPDKVANLIDVVCPPSCRTLVVVGHGTPPADHAADSLYGTIARGLGGTVVIAADSDVSASLTGILYTSGRFRSWRMMPDEGTGQVHRSEPLGDTLPPLPAAPRPVTDATANPPLPAPLALVSAAAQADTVPAEPAVSTRDTPAEPRWITAASCDAQDRLRLRQVLNSSYETHARAVVRELIADLVSSDARLSAATVTGLVAVRAYCATERDGVNRDLRGSGTVRAGDASTLVARCAVYGLRRLPVASGPVFATFPAAVPLEAYQTGSELVEPGFVDVDLSPGDQHGGGVDFLIWSVTAHELGPVAPDRRTTAVFSAGSRFRVLGVQEGAERPRVMLLDVTPPHDGAGDEAGAEPSAESIMERLDPDGLPAGGSGPAPVRLAFPVGLDDSGLPFLPREDA